MPVLISDGSAVTVVNQVLPQSRWPWTSQAVSFGGKSISYEDLWRTQPAVRTVLGFVARNIASLTLHQFRNRADGEREEIGVEDPVVASLRYPAPRVSAFKFWQAIALDTMIYDRAVLLPEPAESGRWTMRRVPPYFTEIVTDAWGVAAGVRITRPGQRAEIVPADRVVMFDAYRPVYLPCPPFEALAQMLMESAEASAYRLQTWQRAARVGTVVERPAESPPWSDTARERFLAEFSALYSGDGPRSGGIAALEEGMKVSPGIHPVTQGDAVEWRQLTVREVCGVYGVQPVAVGLTEGIGYAASKEQRKALYQDTFGPYLEDLAQTVEVQAFPLMGVTDDRYCEWNLAKKLEADFLEQASVMSTSTGAPWVTRNEARRRANLPPLPDGDGLVTPLNVIVGGLASPRDTAPSLEDRTLPKAKAAEPMSAPRRLRHAWTARAEDLLDGYFARLGAVVASRAGASKAKASVADVFDRSRWDAELAADLQALGEGAGNAVGRATLDHLGWEGDPWDDDVIVPWMAEAARRRAEALNGAVADEIAAALDGESGALTRLFEALRAGWVLAIAAAWIGSAAGLGATDAARKAGANTKTWRTTSGDPRPTHAALDGQTVGIDEAFGNGLRWPGDHMGSADETAGCRCDMEVSY